MPLPKFGVKFFFWGGGNLLLENKLEFQISLNSRISIAERIDNEANVRLRLSFYKRKACRLIIKTEVDVKLRYEIICIKPRLCKSVIKYHKFPQVRRWYHSSV
jgi:hypothetical protein